MINIEHQGEEIVQVSHTITHGNNCMGCIRHKKDVMITLVETPGGEQYTDVFLTTEQGEKLYEQLGKVLDRNKEKQNVNE